MIKIYLFVLIATYYGVKINMEKGDFRKIDVLIFAAAIGGLVISTLNILGVHV